VKIPQLKSLLLRVLGGRTMPSLMIEPEPQALEAWRVLLNKTRKG
jgi:hypothetical protein